MNTDLTDLAPVGGANLITAKNALALLRAHGILKKVPHSHRYHVTEQGRVMVTALLTARRANVKQLEQLAA